MDRIAFRTSVYTSIIHTTQTVHQDIRHFKDILWCLKDKWGLSRFWTCVLSGKSDRVTSSQNARLWTCAWREPASRVGRQHSKEFTFLAKSKVVQENNGTALRRDGRRHRVAACPSIRNRRSIIFNVPSPLFRRVPPAGHLYINIIHPIQSLAFPICRTFS